MDNIMTCIYIELHEFKSSEQLYNFLIVIIKYVIRHFPPKFTKV